MFVDHKNLVQIFSPKEVSRPTAQKLQRWALELQRFRYEIEHISGEDNVWADLMTRWGAPTVSADHGVRSVTVRQNHEGDYTRSNASTASAKSRIQVARSR